MTCDKFKYRDRSVILHQCHMRQSTCNQHFCQLQTAFFSMITVFNQLSKYFYVTLVVVLQYLFFKHLIKCLYETGSDAISAKATVDEISCLYLLKTCHQSHLSQLFIHVCSDSNWIFSAKNEYHHK